LLPARLQPTLLAAGLLSCAVSLACGDVQESRYSAAGDAQASLARGWLPAGLPGSATQIHEWHDVDTNESYGSFKFDAGERPRLESRLRLGLQGTVRIDRDPSFSPTVRDPSVAELRNAGFEFYADGDFGLAVEWASGTAYFWGPPR
jgi:hypothetical protein